MSEPREERISGRGFYHRTDLGGRKATVSA